MRDNHDPRPEGRPNTPQHTRGYIVVGLLQGFALTLSIFVLLLTGI